MIFHMTLMVKMECFELQSNNLTKKQYLQRSENCFFPLKRNYEGVLNKLNSQPFAEIQLFTKRSLSISSGFKYFASVITIFKISLK
jgi:hypothetical protein